MKKIKTGPAQLRHIAKIDAFIPEAVKTARKRFPKGAYTARGKEADAFSKEFHREMNRLTVAAGLRVA